MRLVLATMIVATVIVCFSSFLPAAEASEIRGAWRAETYILKAGGQHQVAGHIFFAETDWTVLFFVLGDDEQPKRGSGEGGTYTLDGEDLVLSHLYLLTAGQEMGSLPESPLRMEIHASADAATEPCRAEVDGDSMTLHFPSGNHMTFRRSSH